MTTTTPASTDDEVGDPGPDDRRRQQSARLALGVFVAFVVVALPLILFKFGSYMWFFRDEWQFLTERGLSPSSLMRPHAGHWATIPIIEFRVLYRIFGLRSYVPYQFVLVVCHLTVAVLLRVVMRRAGVGPWVATCAAAVIVLFGPGAQNILWAFQVTFVGALLFGLAQLILIDHDGGLDRRDWLALLAGALALMCSGVGVAMVVIVGMATLLRRGWRMAAFQTVPLGAVFGLWYVVERPNGGNPFGLPSVSRWIRWVNSAEVGTFRAIGHFWFVGLALALLMVGGLVLAWVPLSWSEFRKRAALPLSLFVGSVVFAAFTASERWYFGSAFARSSRYLYVGAVFTLPALAVAADAVVRRWKVAAPAIIAVLVIGIPFNLNFALGPWNSAYFRGQQTNLVGAAYVPFAHDVPTGVRPEPDAVAGTHLTVGWLLGARARGRLPASPHLTSAQVNQLKVRLGVEQTPGAASGRCVAHQAPVYIVTTVGDGLWITQPLRIATRTGRQATSVPVTFLPENGQRLTFRLKGLKLRLTPSGHGAYFTLCSG